MSVEARYLSCDCVNRRNGVMLNRIFQSFLRHPKIEAIERAVASDGCVHACGLGGSSPAFLAAALLKGSDGSRSRRILAVFPEEEEAEEFRDDLEEIIGHASVAFFPERDTNPYEHADSHFEVRSRRVETLSMLEDNINGVVVSSAGALNDPTTPPGLLDLVSLEINTGGTLDFDDFVRSLVAKGFKRQNAVTAAGELAVRGGIVDVFPFGGDIPYRIEFWDDSVESIRTFSTSTQRSLDTVASFRIIPPDEFVIEAGLNRDDEMRIDDVERSSGIDLSWLRRVFEGGERPNGLEQYLHLVFGNRAFLPRYFTDGDLLLLFDGDRSAGRLEKKLEHARTMWDRYRADDDIDLPAPEHFFMAPDETLAEMKRLPTVEIHSLHPPKTTVIDFAIRSSRQYQGNLDELKKDIRSARAVNRRCHILCDNTGQVDRLNELLDDCYGDYLIDVAHLAGGFLDPAAGIVVFTDHEIFSRYRRRVRHRRYKDGVPIPDHRMLILGDFVVHVDYGIGRYMGLKRTEIGGAETDCLVIHYRDEDQLLLPVGQLDKLKKFTAEEGVAPVVSKLGGTAWEKLKARTKKSIQKMADDLLRLYAERKTHPGYAFRYDEHLMRPFVESFVYEETPDQDRSWEQVRADMEKPAPMERLICGDVGFGKTEIAMRAAFMAVLNGKQVVILVPTTILAEQHEKTFRERFADFPVIIESLSRFRSRKEQKDILDRLAQGKVDILVGTHRLLSKDVLVGRLGMLIIDEEQRFGVRHKERLKKIRRNVDVIAMSATPIPRTLNMSLLGARDISYINTPPRDRYSVHTEILPFEEKYVVDAIMREIDRDGQVYFVHNRVQSIESMKAYLQRLMPSVSFGVAHGQLPEKELEKVMREYHERKFQVLVCTMIIENGLDIPSVNTIVINRADTFGLAQLYQLRGRVGRSNRRAFAYLMIPPKASLTKVARQRLRTIEEFVALGSGFNVAMRDMEIRGAGNILGTDQSGFIAAVGFDMYMELLRETIAELKGQKIEKPPDVEVHIANDAFIPDDYVPDPAERVLLYRRLSETLHIGDVTSIEEEIVDRYGRMREPVVNLLDAAYIKHYSASLHAVEVVIRDGTAELYIPGGIEMTRDHVENMVRKSPVKLNFSFQDGMRLHFRFHGDSRGPLTGAKKVLQAMCK